MKHLHRNIAFFLFVSLQINSFLYSQTAHHKFIAFKSEKFDSTDFKKRENELYNKYDSLFINKSWLKEYVQEISTFEQSLSDYGVIYKNWSEASDYLNAVIKEVLGKEWNENIVVQIRRDEENNAFMIEDGKVYINVGMLAAASSEAELAATIGHEYGHYKNLHSYKGFVKEQETKARIRVARLVRYPGAFWVAKSSVSGYYSHSRENESEADRTSIDLMKASGYDLSAIAGNFEKFYTEEKKRAREKGYRNFVYYHTHPPTQERLLNSKKECSKTDTIGRRKFIVGEEMFNRVKRQAIDECIYLALKNFDFKSVTEACYSQLLFYPNDEFYMFYLCESIRRNLSVHPSEGTNYFITGAYIVYERYIPPSNQAKVSLSRKIPKINGTELSKTINYQYDFLLFGNNKELIDKLPVNSLTSNDTIEFVTNKEALDYFISRQIKLQHSSVNFVLSMIKPDTTVGVINSPNTDLNDYNEIITGLKKKVKESEVCIIPLSLDYNNEDLVFWKTANNHINQFTKVMSNLKSICRYPFYILEFANLYLQDKRMIYDFLNGLKQFDVNQSKADNFFNTNRNENKNLSAVSKINAISLFPEIVPFLLKNHISKIAYMDISLNEKDSQVSVGPMGGIPMGTVKTINFSDYYLDLDDPCYFTKHYITKGGKTLFFSENIAAEIYTGVKIMAQENSAKNGK